MEKEIDRVFSFSCKSYDSKSVESINDLRKYSRRTGITFSFLVVKAIKGLLKEIENERPR